MHTLYWQMLFDERNLNDGVYQLNGQAEVFFRKKSLNYTKPTHPANQAIANKNPFKKKDKSEFTYDLIKDKRFTMDKFLFHVPITINFKSSGIDNIDLKVRQWLQKADDVHIIGIDRGERHLLYLTVIDCKGNIKEQMSLNTIENEYKGDTYAFDYHKRLDEKEKERDEAKKSWKTVENIKELKEGYLSQAIHKITQLMLKYNAIIVLEDLNKPFMRGRLKVEKQVYQKFEKMLIDKLNYLADKKKDPSEMGGVLNAYQLTSKFKSFAELGRQSGFLFYIPAAYTSKIDPVSGFVNLFNFNDLTNTITKKEFFSKFDDIKFISHEEGFKFTFDYSNFKTYQTDFTKRWTISTQGKRIMLREKDGHKQMVDYYPTTDILDTLTNAGFTITPKMDIKAIIDTVEANKSNAYFFNTLLFAFKATLQMRNSNAKTEEDFIISPVCVDGKYYNSDIEAKNGKDEEGNWKSKLPVDADANGAYNIARKGLMILNQIKQTSDLKKPKYDLTNKAWLNFVQKGYADKD